MWQEPLRWNWTSVWLATNGFPKAMLVLLLIMLFHVCLLFVGRVLKVRATIKQIHSLGSAATPDKALQCGVLAKLFIDGFDTFQSALLLFPRGEAAQFARRAIERGRLLLYAEMKRGTSTISTIAAVSPLVGLAGTVVSLLEGLRGGSNTPTGWMVYYANVIALSLLPTALGMLVGVIAVSFYNHLIRTIEIFDLESSNASGSISRYLMVHTPDPPSGNLTPTGELMLFKSRSGWEAPFDGYYVLLGSVWLVWFYVFGVIGWACLWSLKYG